MKIELHREVKIDILTHFFFKKNGIFFLLLFREHIIYNLFLLKKKYVINGIKARSLLLTNNLA